MENSDQASKDEYVTLPGAEGDRKLYVVCCISNPVMYQSRYRLYRQFAKHMKDSGVILYTVEMAHGNRPFMVTASDNPHHVQVRGDTNLWLKEALINIGIRALPKEADNIAWIDADVHFANPNWVQDTIEQLEHYDVVQLFSYAMDLTPRSEPSKKFTGFMHDYVTGAVDFKPGGGYNGAHSGFAWAAKRSALNAVGGLMDFAIAGSADRHMACALIGLGEISYHKNIHDGYRIMVSDWQKRAEKHIQRRVGYVAGLVLHGFHGSKAKRQYGSRWKMLVDHEFDPRVDLYRDTQGLYCLTDEKIGLRDAIRRYLRTRSEDGSDPDTDDKAMP